MPVKNLAAVRDHYLAVAQGDWTVLSEPVPDLESAHISKQAIRLASGKPVTPDMGNGSTTAKAPAASAMAAATRPGQRFGRVGGSAHTPPGARRKRPIDVGGLRASASVPSSLGQTRIKGPKPTRPRVRKAGPGLLVTTPPPGQQSALSRMFMSRPASSSLLAASSDTPETRALTPSLQASIAETTGEPVKKPITAKQAASTKAKPAAKKAAAKRASDKNAKHKGTRKGGKGNSKADLVDGSAGVAEMDSAQAAQVKGRWRKPQQKSFNADVAADSDGHDDSARDASTRKRGRSQSHGGAVAKRQKKSSLLSDHDDYDHDDDDDGDDDGNDYDDGDDEKADPGLFAEFEDLNFSEEEESSDLPEDDDDEE